MCFLCPSLGSGRASVLLLLLFAVLIFTGIAGAPRVLSQPTCDNCVLENGWPSEGTTTNSDVADPQPYNPAGSDGIRGTADDDYRGDKNAGSPLIDAGNSSYWSGRDINSKGISGDASDIGPFESSGSALPVEVARFDAILQADRVRLSWTTASETNNAGFAVERRPAESSSGEEGWTTVERVKGAGTTSRPQSYDLVDEDLPAVDTLRYRLRQIDTDGSETLSEPVRVVRQEPTHLRLASPAPNPASGPATVRLAVSENAGNPQLVVYDLLGRRLWTTALSGGRSAQRLPTASLAPGTYVVRLETTRGATSTRLTVVR
jgi:hypothetical protein